MGSCLITLKNETNSQRAGKLLKDNGIYSSVVKLGNEYNSKGCGHGVRIDCLEKARAIRLLKENGIPFSDVKSL